jgi:iron complex outermembrane receptor protein
MMRNRIFSMSLLTGLGMIGIANPAVAETAGDAESAAAGESAAGGESLSEIVVTAQRRDESLSKTPVAVAVLSADTLAKASIVSEQDLRVATPGLTVRASGSSNQLNYALRGNTTDAFAASRPGVLPYINEVQIGGPGGSSAFYDLQSVQVLKGPQGTLFGRSATGGAVLFTTAKPTADLGGYISLLGGDYSNKKAEGALNVPLVGNVLLARVAGFFQERDGFQQNLYDGGREGDIKRGGVRASLTAAVGAIHNDLMFDYFNSDSSSTVPVLSGLVANGFPIGSLYAGVATPQARATGIGTIQAFLPPAFASLVPAFYDAYFSKPGHFAGGITQFLADQQARGPYVIDSDNLNKYKANNIIVTNRTAFQISPDTEFRNIFGYTHLKTFNTFENDGTPYAIAESIPKGNPAIGVHNLTKQTSDELQLVGKILSNRLAYVTGIYISDESYDNTNDFVALDILLGGQQPAYHYIIKNRTYAGYAQGTYALNDSGLAFTLGTRYTSEKVTKILPPGDSNRVLYGDPAPPGFSYDKSDTYDKVSWSVGLQDQINNNLLVYAASRRAYKSGGFNGTSTPQNGLAVNGGDAFAAEQVTDVELGLKFQGEIAAIPTRANLALYNDWLGNRQTLAYELLPTGPSSVTVNVPHAKIYGLELEGEIKPVDWLDLGGTFNYAHAAFSRDPVIFANAPPVIFDQVPDVAKTSGTLYAEVTVPATADLNVILRGDLYAQAQSFSFSQSQNNPGNDIPGYGLADFRVGVESRKVGWSVNANIKNAFNHVYYVGGIPLGEALGLNTLMPGEPRTYTVEARYKF